MKRNLFLLLILLNLNVFSQSEIDVSGLESGLVNYSGAFLDINTSVRLAGFGEVGVVSSSFYKNTGVYQNPALISRNSEYAGVNAFYMPWLSNMVRDINFSGLSGFYAIDSLNAFALNFTYFDLGNLDFTNEFGDYQGNYDPYELYLKFGYTHSFNNSISTGIALKYFRSDIVQASYTELNVVNSVAFDLGFNYSKQYKLRNQSSLNTSAGVAITNLGPKISYVQGESNFIPTKLSLGLFINPDIHMYNYFRLNFDLGYQAEKYLVPTPPVYDFDGNIIAGYDSDISSFKALYQSFYDAPGGFDEEINEIKHKFGSEFRFSFKDYAYIAFRHGRFLEHETKGNRNYQTFGYGIGAFGFMLDYMKIKADDNSSLDGTWAISLGLAIDLNKEFLKF